MHGLLPLDWLEELLHQPCTDAARALVTLGVHVTVDWDERLTDLYIVKYLEVEMGDAVYVWLHFNHACIYLRCNTHKLYNISHFKV